MLTPMMTGGSRSALPARLSDIYAKLGEQERRSLLDYAEFLLQRQQDAGESEPITAPAEPELQPRPESESVVAAIKRLTRSYPMLEKQALFSGTSELMSAHLLQVPQPPVVTFCSQRPRMSISSSREGRR